MDYLEIRELYHHGIKGQRWGIRRYQNPDGTLTPEGKAKYGTVDNFNKQNAAKNKLASESSETRKAIGKSTVGGLKGLGVTYAGSVAAIGAYTSLKLLKVGLIAKKLDKGGTSSSMLKGVDAIGGTLESSLKMFERFKKAYPALLALGTATGATLAYKNYKKNKQQQEVAHSGIKGQRWGIRRYQNPDGTLTDAGKVRYNSDGSKKKLEKMSNEELNKANQRLSAERNYNNLIGKNYKNRSAASDIALKAGISSIGSALLTTGGYLLKEKAKHPEIALGSSVMKTAGMLGMLGAGVGAISSLVTSLGGQTYIQNIGDQKKKK